MIRSHGNGSQAKTENWSIKAATVVTHPRYHGAALEATAGLPHACERTAQRAMGQTKAIYQL